MDSLSFGNFCYFPGSVFGPLLIFCGPFPGDFIHTLNCVPGHLPLLGARHGHPQPIGHVCLDVLSTFSVSMFQPELISPLNKLLSVIEVIDLGVTLDVYVIQIAKLSLSMKQNLNKSTILSLSSPSSTLLPQQPS